MRLDDLLCDACLTRLQDWLAQNGDGVSLHDFLKTLLLVGNANLENFYCDRCTDKCMQPFHVGRNPLQGADSTSIPRPRM